MLAGGWLCTCLGELTPRVNLAMLDCPVCDCSWTYWQLHERRLGPVRWDRTWPTASEFLDKMRRSVSPRAFAQEFLSGDFPQRSVTMTVDEAKRAFPDMAEKIDDVAGRAVRVSATSYYSGSDDLFAAIRGQRYLRTSVIDRIFGAKPPRRPRFGRYENDRQGRLPPPRTWLQLLREDRPRVHVTERWSDPARRWERNDP
jgi:hypothetical protein